MDTPFTPEALPVLKEKLELLNSMDRLSISDAIELTNEIWELARSAASSLEAAGDLAAAAAVYEDVAEALQKASPKVPEENREVFAALVDFWSVTAKLKRDSLPIVSETGETEALLPRWERHISVKTRLPQQIGAVLHEQEGRAIVRNSRLGIGKRGIAFGKDFGKG